MSALTIPLAAERGTTRQIELLADEAHKVEGLNPGRRSFLIYNAEDHQDGTTNTTWVWVGFDSADNAIRHGFPILPGRSVTVSNRRPTYLVADAALTVYVLAELDGIAPCDLPGGGS